MEPREYDVVFCHGEEPGSALHAVIAEGLARRGFRVFDAGAGQTDGGSPTLETIEATADFVVLVTPDAFDLSRDRSSRMRAQVAHALRSDRNIVPVYAPGFTSPPDGDVPPEILALDSRHPVQYLARAGGESVARIARRLSSDAAVDERAMLRQAKWIGGFVGVVLVALVAIAVVGVASKMFARRIDVRPLPPLVLHWSVFGQRNDSGHWTATEVNDGALARGTRVRVAFSPSGDGHAYVLSRDARGEVEVLFPSPSLTAASRVTAGQVYQAPGDGRWLAVDDRSGVDTIYIVASYDPIENLESLVDDRDEEASAGRAAFLDATIAGLLDGRHAGASGRVRTRSGRPIADNVVRGAAAPSLTLTLSGGERVTHRLVSQEGLVSAFVELRVQPSHPPR